MCDDPHRAIFAGQSKFVAKIIWFRHIRLAESFEGPVTLSSPGEQIAQVMKPPCGGAPGHSLSNSDRLLGVGDCPIVQAKLAQAYTEAILIIAS